VPSFAYSLACVVLAYLIGAIPFGYLVAWARGVDIRKVGSGNIGATNVGRVLGFRFFVVVFVLDLLKGFLPTFEFPRLAASLTGQGSAPALGVFVALASILGHNFPIYLRFRGGKGVATSLGALLALDTIAAVSAAAGFGMSLLATRYVSVSSLFGGVVFAVVHFVRTPHPFSRDQIAMTVVTIALLLLLFFRHRKNLARLRTGTEPKVPLRRPKKPPEGKIAWVFLLAVAAVGGAMMAIVARQATRRTELRMGRCTLIEVARVATGHQRAERLAFLDGGGLLAVTCPRYNRVMLYRVTSDAGLELQSDIALEGRPVALAAASDRFYVLERPAGDARHVEPGFWETFDRAGRRIGARYRVGFYPDDLAITPDGMHALVLTSGRAEGDANKPSPALTVIALDSGSDTHRLLGRIALDQPGDDPDRLSVGASGRTAAVRLTGNNQTLTVDLSDVARPFVVARAPGASPEERLGLNLPGLGGCEAFPRQKESAVDFYEAVSMRSLGRLPIRGPMNVSPTRPTGLAYSDERGLLAIATRSGSVHLIAARPQSNNLPGPDVSGL
jgi:glycerol-3-phosphate acyltransferase PlsY